MDRCVGPLGGEWVIFRACFLTSSYYIIPYEDQENMVFSILFLSWSHNLPLYKPNCLYFLGSFPCWPFIPHPVLPLSPLPPPLPSLLSAWLLFFVLDGVLASPGSVWNLDTHQNLRASKLGPPQVSSTQLIGLNYDQKEWEVTSNGVKGVVLTTHEERGSRNIAKLRKGKGERKPQQWTTMEDWDQVCAG